MHNCGSILNLNIHDINDFGATDERVESLKAIWLFFDFLKLLSRRRKDNYKYYSEDITVLPSSAHKSS